jgi:dTDP-4-dehydrorhamnose 3,5-epimerase
VTIRTTRIPGMLVVEPSTASDDRGTFTELYQARELARHGWRGAFVRTAISHNRRRATLRGLHFQRPPWADAKLVTCLRGAMFDVVADVRPSSPAFGSWEGVELTAENRTCVFVPEGVAHGFETLDDETTLLYHIGAYHEPDASAGVRWDDPALGIAWPLPPVVLSDQDRAWGPLAR